MIILKNNPRAFQIINSWFVKKLIDSLDNSNIPKEFMNVVKTTEISEKQVATMITSNPRILFDVLDENNIHVNIILDYKTKKYSYTLDGKNNINGFDSRKTAEWEAIKEGIIILNKK